jgi:phytoene desaturase
MPKAIVIGAGFGGIAAALRLRKKGYDVTVLEKQIQLGGRATQYRRETPLGTFIHDAGPTVVTAKFLFDELFELFGKKREDYIDFRDIFPWYRLQFADKSTFNYGGTLAQMEAEIARFEPADIEGFRRFLAHSRKIFDVGFTKLGSVPFDEPSMMFKAAPDLIRLQSYKTVYQLAKKYFKNESLRRVFSFQPLLVGGNPFNTTSIYSLVFYLEREWGVQFAMGGTGAIVHGLEKLMREEGIEIRLGEEVARITVHTGPAFAPRSLQQSVVGGVELKSGASLPAHRVMDGASVVVANGDAPQVWQKLISPKFHTRKSKWWMPRLKYSMGLYVLYFGTKKTYPEIAHHTIVLGETYRELIEKLFDAREIETKDLSVYLHRPTATDPSMAPEGCESFYVLVPVPNLQPKKTNRGVSAPLMSSAVQHERGAHATEMPLTADGVIDWSRYGNTFRDLVINYLERTILPNLRENIVDPFYVTPDHFRDNLNSMHGAGFSIQPIFSQSAYFRFHNKAPGIEGLYFTGAGTHPGAGMPGVLCSAKVLEHLIPDVKTK